MTNVVSIAEAYAKAEPKSVEWPNPMPLPFALPPVPQLPPTLLPTQFGPWLEDIAERLNVPLDFVGIPAMVAAGSLIGAGVGVRPQAKTTWTEPANLWGVVVGSPGSLKSPAVTEVLAPMRRLDARADEAYQNELAYYEQQMTAFGLKKDAALKRAKRALQSGDIEDLSAYTGSDGMPNSPIQKRYLLTDATVEKLGEICSSNSNGILVYRDELLTLLADLEGEEKAPARGFFMTGWTGKDYYSFDRIGRGTIRIPRVNLSLVGTTQPVRLAKYIRASLNDKGDGMVQRLQLLAWPDATSDWRNVDRFPDSDARTAAYECFDRLANLVPESVGAWRDPFEDERDMPHLRFDAAAVEVFVDYRVGLEAKLRGDELPSALVEHLSKYRGLIPRLALICHLASGETGLVSARAVSTALGWAEYLEAHARRAYGSLAIDSGEMARTIWKRIEKGDLRDGFTERDIYSRGWSNLARGPRLSDGLKLLEDCDWIKAQILQTGGRPSTVYAINPAALQRPALVA